LSKIEVDEIVKQSGSTLTLGGPGTAVTLGSGATQTGFGRTGTVDWQTTPKTTTFTAVNGEGYFINSGSAITVNLPAGSAGAIVAVSDYARNFSTYNLTIAANGSEKIGGSTDDALLQTDGQAATLLYVDSTKGWVNIQNAEDTFTGLAAAYVSATGGTVTNSPCGDFKVHTFTSNGCFAVTGVGNSIGSNTVEYLVVAGGGGGGADSGGGGGAGGTRYNFPSPVSAGLTVTTPTTYPITIGAGGAGANEPGSGSNGSNSVFSTITSAGGGGGSGSVPVAGGSGGSGGGGRKGTGSAAGAGNTPPVSPPQGNPGGVGATGGPKNNTSGSGGGACNAGQAGACGPGPTTQQFTVGGDGKSFPTAAWGSSGDTQPTGQFFGGGGGSGQGGPSGSGNTPYDTPLGNGGKGGGGPGGDSPGPGSPDAQVHGRAGTANTGGGGGGSAEQCAPGGRDGGAGGSGIVIIRYKFQN
jgi:hypothetical protein